MKRSPGRPPKAKKKSEYLDIRIGADEKQTFKDAAALAGIPVSTWVRERLRRSAIKELEEAGQPIAFLKNVSIG